MDPTQHSLLLHVCEGDIKAAQKAARSILVAPESKHSEAAVKERLLDTLNKTQNREVEVPYIIKDVLVVEDPRNFNAEHFILRPEDEILVKRVHNVRNASRWMVNNGLNCAASFLLYGPSGVGKTELARYIAYCEDLPFVYVRFSNLVTSQLGGTQNNLAQCFTFAQRTPCVLCFDEIDAIGLERGQANDFGEMNRIVIAMMQELDHMPPHVILCGTTNRFDMLDQALVRRFLIRHKMNYITDDYALSLCKNIVSYVSKEMYISDQELLSLPVFGKEGKVSTADVVSCCKEFLIKKYCEKTR